MLLKSRPKKSRGGVSTHCRFNSGIANSTIEGEKRAAKARAAEEKTAAKQEKEAEKTKKLEEDRLAREQHKPKDVPVADSTTEDITMRDNEDLYQEPTPSTEIRNTPGHDHESAVVTSPGPPKGLKSLLNKLKRRSKHSPAAEPDESTKENETAFVGGAALRDSVSHVPSQSQPSKSTIQSNRASTESRMSALADASTEAVRTKPAYVPHVDNVDDDRYSDVSSLSSDGDEFDMARGRSPERVVSGGTAASGAENFEEARDHFDENLAPPPAFGSEVENARKGSPNRESKFQEVGL